MLKTLKIAGVEHPFLFGFYAMLFVEEDLGFKGQFHDKKD